MKNFSIDFWRDFLKTNNDFTETCVIKDAISSEMLNELNLGIMEVLSNRLSMKDINNGIRIYIEGKEQDDDYLKKFVKLLLLILTILKVIQIEFLIKNSDLLLIVVNDILIIFRTIS
ncbi:hypothetical protein LEQ04_07215 [Riemerella anatipestifer]|nr:hypothetical protein LEQ04_07215 [Riemerella anatipestifer]